MHETNGSNGARTLSPPVRNRFFYGKLMDTRHFELEQLYFLEQRRLLNRLAHGVGVVCGLEVEPTDDGKLIVRPGVAIDARGREIVVTTPVCLDQPLVPTDPCRADDEEASPVVGDWLTLELCYHECEAEPAPVLVSDCDTRNDCKPSVVRERFRLDVSAGRPEQRPGGLTTEQCGAIFPADPPDDFDRRRAACETLTGTCPPATGDCVVLATYVARAEGQALLVDECSYRTSVYSNATLLDLIFCLAARVDECCGRQPPLTTFTNVTAIWPENGEVLSQGASVERLTDWLETPRIELTFSREPDPTRLGSPAPWLRAWGFARSQVDEPTLIVVPLELELFELEDEPVVGQGGHTVGYRLGSDVFENRLADLTRRSAVVGPPLELRFLVQLRAEDDSTDLIDRENPPQLLDADFRGTKVPPGRLDELWETDQVENLTGAVVDEIWDGLTDSGRALPSGDVDAGGRFDSVFTVTAKPPTTAPPRVMTHWPKSGVRMAHNERVDELARWVSQPLLVIEFERKLTDAGLGSPEPWLRLWELRALGVNEIFAKRLKLILAGVAGPEATYTVEGVTGGVPARYLVQMHSEQDAIVDEAEGLELDADFTGTKLVDVAGALDAIWEIEDEEGVPQSYWDTLVDAGASLPSGDGDEGGRFHLTFEVDPG